LSGDWKNAGDTIRFDKDGSLIDGQHRLLACVNTNLAQNFLIVYGLDSEVFDVIDNGKGRTNADVLGMKHYKDPAIL
ncbi:ParB N-terminal domain-containing protein, partial [Staphylococcus aureus]